MSDETLHPSDSASAESLKPLTQRVRARVAEVELALERRAGASRQKTKRSRQLEAAASSPTPAQNAEAAREARSIRQVFHELGDTHRKYRLRTGQRIPTALRDAGRAFKQAPNLASLVLVAAHLDEAGILGW